MLKRTVELCRPCRMWQLPHREPKVSEDTPLEAGKQVEADFKFYRGNPAFHIIDRLLKFHNGEITPNRAGDEMHRVLRRWFVVVRTKNLWCDREGAMKSDEMGIWLQRRGEQAQHEALAHPYGQKMQCASTGEARPLPGEEASKAKRAAKKLHCCAGART